MENWENVIVNQVEKLQNFIRLCATIGVDINSFGGFWDFGWSLHWIWSYFSTV